MTESKSVALPLGYSPISCFEKSPTESCRGRLLFVWGGRWDSNPRSSEPQSDALTKLRYAHHVCGSTPAKSLSAWFPFKGDGILPVCGKGAPPQRRKIRPRPGNPAGARLYKRANRSGRHPRQRQIPGAPTGIRTQDLLLRRQLLYPTELLAQITWSGQWESNPPIQLGRLAY